MRSRILAAILGSVVLSQANAAPTYHSIGQAAIAAARMAAPRPPETLEQYIHSLNYLSLHKWELFDANHDGALSRDEWLEFTFSAYLIFNESGDGKVKFTEYAQFINGPVHHPLLSLRSMRELHAQFDAMDHGKRGYLTIEEFRDVAESFFLENDLNHDGFITEAELNEVATRSRRR